MHISPWFAGRKEKSMKYLNKVVEIILEVLVAYKKLYDDIQKYAD